jgi:hypothetical protein
LPSLSCLVSSARVPERRRIMATLARMIKMKSNRLEDRVSSNRALLRATHHHAGSVCWVVSSTDQEWPSGNKWLATFKSPTVLRDSGLSMYTVFASIRASETMHTRLRLNPRLLLTGGTLHLETPALTWWF